MFTFVFLLVTFGCLALLVPKTRDRILEYIPLLEIVTRKKKTLIGVFFLCLMISCDRIQNYPSSYATDSAVKALQEGNIEPSVKFISSNLISNAKVILSCRSYKTNEIRIVLLLNGQKVYPVLEERSDDKFAFDNVRAEAFVLYQSDKRDWYGSYGKDLKETDLTYRFKTEYSTSYFRSRTDYDIDRKDGILSTFQYSLINDSERPLGSSSYSCIGNQADAIRPLVEAYAKQMASEALQRAKEIRDKNNAPKPKTIF